MVNIDNSKKSTKSSKLCSSKIFHILNTLRNVLFFYNLSLKEFFILSKVF